MKVKKFWPRGEVRVPYVPLDPPLPQHLWMWETQGADAPSRAIDLVMQFSENIDQILTPEKSWIRYCQKEEERSVIFGHRIKENKDPSLCTLIVA